MKLADIFKIEVDKKMKDDELLLKFPKGQEYKNIRITNIGQKKE